jgi:SOS-response transcriptional repressor LexA
MPPVDKLRESLRDESRAWLESVIESTGMTANAIATKADVSASNLHKLLNKKDWPHPLSDAIKRKIAAATGMPLPGAAKVTRAGGLSDVEIEPFDSEAAESLPAQALNNADWWQVRTRLLDLEGYLPGDAVLVNLNEAPRANDIVVAQVTRDQGRTVETVFRKYEPPFLTVRTTETDYPRPELVDGDRVVIMGVVTNSWRRRHSNAA